MLVESLYEGGYHFILKMALQFPEMLADETRLKFKFIVFFNNTPFGGVSIFQKPPGRLWNNGICMTPPPPNYCEVAIYPHE